MAQTRTGLLLIVNTNRTWIIRVIGENKRIIGNVSLSGEVIGVVPSFQGKVPLHPHIRPTITPRSTS